MEAQAIFPNLFTICCCSFVVRPFVDEETNGSYPFANGLNGLAHLCLKQHLIYKIFEKEIILGYFVRNTRSYRNSFTSDHFSFSTVQQK